MIERIFAFELTPKELVKAINDLDFSDRIEVIAQLIESGTFDSFASRKLKNKLSNRHLTVLKHLTFLEDLWEKHLPCPDPSLLRPDTDYSGTVGDVLISTDIHGTEKSA